MSRHDIEARQRLSTFAVPRRGEGGPWEEVAERYGQPIDPSVWLTDPLSSSYPPSVAGHAARTIAPEREEDYLRRIRQALFLEGRNIARPEILVACATEIGLDAGRFRAALADPASEAAFRADLEARKRLGIRGFPTLIVAGPAVEEPWMMRGTQPFFRLDRALQAVIGGLPPAREASVEAVLQEYGSGTTREFSEVLQLDEEATKAALERAGARSWSVAGSQLWRDGQRRRPAAHSSAAESHAVTHSARTDRTMRRASVR